MGHITIKGAKGGGGSFKQTPDNLRSEDSFEGVLGVCIGPIKGPVRGLKSVRLDGTAMENETGQSNFIDFVGTFADGDPLKFPQKVQLKLGAGASPTPVNLQLKNIDGSNPIWVTRTINNTNADFLDLRFVANQLFRQDKKGVYTTTATIEIQMKPVGSTNWINPTIGSANGNYNEQGININLLGSSLRVLAPREAYDDAGIPRVGTPNFQITGKTTSPAVYELRIAVPNEGAYANTAWDVRARLIERETYQGGKDNVDQETRNISWESIAAVYSTVLGEHEDWRGVSWLQLTGKASDQINGVPEVDGDFDCKIVSVPPASVFNPETRQYVNGATWDGSWAKAYTNDPAWVINDAISDSLSGLSLIAQGSYLNKWDALELSKWCSTMVPDGNGGLEPRYSLNVAIRDQMKAEDFIRYLAGAVGGLAWDQGDGEWRVKVDKPEAPSDLFTLDNIEGEFLYSHTDVDTRYNDVTMTFLNEEMDFREDRVRLYHNQSIAKIGRKPTTLVAVGCNKRQEAMRRGKLRIEAAAGETRVVNFTTNRRGRNVEHLDTILVADGDLGDRDKRTQGRTIAVSSDRKTITLRDSVYLAPGVAYTLRFATRNNGYGADTTSPNWRKPTLADARAVTNSGANTGQVSVLTLDFPLPVSIPDNLVVALEATNLVTVPKLYRVTNVVYAEDGERVSISALEVKTDKWLLADNVSKEDTVFQDLRGAVPMPIAPPDGHVLTVTRTPAEQGEHVTLTANWQRPAGAFISGFRVRYSVNGGEWLLAAERLQNTSLDIVNPGSGTYQVEIVTLDRRGGISLPLYGTADVVQGVIIADEILYDDGKTIEYYKPAEPNATYGAPGTSPVGTSTADVVVDRINAAHGALYGTDAQTVGIIAKVDDLINNGGGDGSSSAAAAAASANAAATAQSNAELAAQNAETARQGAEGAYSSVATAAGNAETFRNQASTYSSNAAGSASTASEQAVLAASAKKTAQDAAFAANVSAGTASSKADEAGTSAQAAQTSLVRASTFALDAAGRATSNIVGRGSFDERGAGNWGVGPGIGSVVQDVNAGGFYILQQRNRDLLEGDNLIPGDWGGRRFRVSGNAAAYGSFSANLGLQYRLKDGSLGTYYVFARPAGSGYGDFTNEFVLPADVVAARPALVSDGPYNNAAHGVAWRTIRIEDITARKAAEDFADAASASYESAKIEAGKADGYAQAASGHADTARVRKEDAEGYALSASGSAATASSKAASAAQSATLAARFTAGGNLAPNTDLPNGDTSGWGLYIIPGVNAPEVDRGVNKPGGDQWHPIGENALSFHQVGKYSDQPNIIVGTWYSAPVTAIPDEWYQCYAYGASHRCNFDVDIVFMDAGGNWLDAVASDQTNAGGGQHPENWAQRGIPARKAPPGTVTMKMEIRKYDTWADQADSWLWVWRRYLGAAREGQVAFNVYSPGNPRLSSENALAKIETVSQVAATAGQAASQLRQVLRADTLDQNASIEEIRQAAANSLDRVSGARITQVARAGNGRAQLSLYAFDDNGNITSGVDIIGDLTISGNLFVDGSINKSKVGQNQITQSPSVGGEADFTAVGSWVTATQLTVNLDPFERLILMVSGDAVGEAVRGPSDPVSYTVSFDIYWRLLQNGIEVRRGLVVSGQSSTSGESAMSPNGNFSDFVPIGSGTFTLQFFTSRKGGTGTMSTHAGGTIIGLRMW